MHHAWHVAMLTRQAIGGLLDPKIAMTPLADLLSTAEAQAPPAPKTAAELQAAIEAWLGPPPSKTGD